MTDSFLHYCPLIKTSINIHHQVHTQTQRALICLPLFQFTSPPSIYIHHLSLFHTNKKEPYNLLHLSNTSHQKTYHKHNVELCTFSCSLVLSFSCSCWWSLQVLHLEHHFWWYISSWCSSTGWWSFIVFVLVFLSMLLLL